MPVHAERMSLVDTAWWRMDNDVNLMMIVGVWLMQPGISHAALCERVTAKLLKYERFRQKVVQDVAGTSWVPDEHFDVYRHVVHERLHRKRGRSEREALQSRAGELAGTPLDPAHPLWQFHLIDHFDGGSAMIVRIHHCIGDGIALTSVMLSITDGGADPPRRKKRHTQEAKESDWLIDLASKAIGIGASGALSSGVQVISDAAALALMPDDSPTRLKGKPSGQKVVAWGEPMPLDRVKAIGKALDCSVNDVLLASVAGAMGHYLRDCGDDPTGQEIRAMVPVNLRPLEHAWQLGNRFGLAPLVLPIGIENPIERVEAVRARMNELKGSYQPLLAFGVLAVAGLLIKPMQDALLGLFSQKTTAVMTNVPGPATPLKFCGAKLRQMMFWVPTSGDVGMGVSILSYAGGVQFGLITDRQLCPDPQKIIDRFEPEFEKLLWVTLMLPWGGSLNSPE